MKIRHPLIFVLLGLFFCAERVEITNPYDALFTGDYSLEVELSSSDIPKKIFSTRTLTCHDNGNDHFAFYKVKTEPEGFIASAQKGEIPIDDPVQFTFVKSGRCSLIVTGIKPNRKRDTTITFALDIINPFRIFLDPVSYHSGTVLKFTLQDTTCTATDTAHLSVKWYHADTLFDNWKSVKNDRVFTDTFTVTMTPPDTEVVSAEIRHSAGGSIQLDTIITMLSNMTPQVSFPENKIIIPVETLYTIEADWKNADTLTWHLHNTDFTEKTTSNSFRHTWEDTATDTLTVIASSSYSTVRDTARLVVKPAEDPFESDTGELDVVSELLAAPLIFAPTKDRFEVNAVVADGDPKTIRLFVQRSVDKGWTEVETVRYPAFDIVEWSVTDLSPGTVYPYAIATEEDALKALEEADDGGVDSGVDASADLVLYSGSVVTQRESGESFSVAFITDTHIGADLDYSNQGIPEVLREVGVQVKNYRPDFIINLGDIVDFHQYGFEPPPSGSALRAAYLNYRSLLRDAIGLASHFQVIGNWDGENGWFTGEEVAASRGQRHLYMPGPSSDTYPEGGSTEGGYYAFTWGDALFIVLNVQSYITNMLSLGGADGDPDDWTLGEEQLAWLKTTLESASSTWRFICIHHTVGGAAGDVSNSIYGRGGGLAAQVGEQATVHQLMIDYEVDVFFYGHDHVFTDMIVDGIHYTLPGSAGAPWLFTKSETGYDQYWGESGWAKVDVSPNSVHVQFIDMDGNPIYDYTL